MEDNAQNPADHADASESNIERAEGVGVWDGRKDVPMQATIVSPEVSGGTEHRERFLHSKEAAKRPFTVELDDGLWRVRSESSLGNNVLASIVAFRWAAPEEEAAVES